MTAKKKTPAAKPAPAQPLPDIVFTPEIATPNQEPSFDARLGYAATPYLAWLAANDQDRLRELIAKFPEVSDAVREISI